MLDGRSNERDRLGMSRNVWHDSPSLERVVDFYNTFTFLDLIVSVLILKFQ